MEKRNNEDASDGYFDRQISCFTRFTHDRCILFPTENEKLSPEIHEISKTI